MSYGFVYPCYNCKKAPKTLAENGCKDSEKIREAIDRIHMSNDGTHQGAGTIVLSCSKMDSETK